MASRQPEGTLYDLLDVNASATFEEIDTSYHRIVSYLDTGSLAIYSMIDEEEVVRKRSAVDEAYRTLSDPDRRAAYDRVLSDGNYPTVIVPEPASGASLSVGHIGTVSSDEAIDDRPETHVPQRGPATRAQPTQPAAQQASTRTRTRRLKPNVDIDPTEETEFSGALLRRLRESAGATLQDVAEITKISKRYLRAIEDNDFEGLPAAVYVRGFVCEYAKVLGFDPQMVAKSYMALYQRYKREGGQG